jgi:hypothetical protein
MFGIGDNGYTAQIRNNVPQDFQALAVELGRHERQTSHIPTRPRETVGEPCRNGIAAEDVNNGYWEAEGTDFRDGSALRDDKVHGKLDQSRCKFGNAFCHIVAVPIFYREMRPST